MVEPANRLNQNVFDLPSRTLGDGRGSSGDGGGPTDRMMERIEALEDSQKELRATLKEIRDAQHKAELDAERRTGDLNRSLSDLTGELKALREAASGLRRDLDKLPTDFGVAKIMVFVIGGLGATALLIKNVLPAITRALTP